VLLERTWALRFSGVSAKTRLKIAKWRAVFAKICKKLAKNAENASESLAPIKMKNPIILGLLALGCLPVLIVMGLAACSRPANHSVAVDVDYWTCGMHPSVRSKSPGKCPICGMELVAVASRKTDASGSPNSNQLATGSVTARQLGGRKELSYEDVVLPSDAHEFIVPIQRQQQIGVTYAEVRRRDIRVDIRSVGTLEADQGQVVECVARVDGYIEELQVTSPGERVTVGQPLMTIYSPDLRAPEQELISLLRAQANGSAPAGSMDQLIDLARRRLQVLNVGANEIAELERTGQATDRLVLRSPEAQLQGAMKDFEEKNSLESDGPSR
jgi:Barrel-sandwich domain of CusB or HlyD membrane-fusion/Heavy metal binding domain